MRDRNNPKGGQPYQNPAPDPVPAPAVQAAWPDDESRQTVVQTNMVAWRENDTAARESRDEAARVDAEIGRLNDLIREKAQEKARLDLHADQRERARDGFGFVLTSLGVTPSPVRPVDGVKVAPRDDPFPTGAFHQYAGQVPDGYCTQCGQPAWYAPGGATHGFGKTCNPEDPNSSVATLPAPEGVAS